MTKGEIKRALKMCADGCFRICCPYGAGIDCCGKLKRDALDLITEQEKEIEFQVQDRARLQREVGELEQAHEQRVEEIERLKAENKQAKIDVLNELKKRSYTDNDFKDGKWHRYVLIDDIDQMIEEIENDN